ncbi:MAG: Rpn family recombination-promoting nuclease/putative transposase [Rickettsiales bacterium]|jgi:predicted transposase/invertase (TIGR01784 family)|nr:Rpn family recombination-promoting nuclease/putative transposase [Rickettsiales bacterium]
MDELKHGLTNDIVFKMFFEKRQDLLKELVAQILSMPIETIREFNVMNPEIPPDLIEDKFCRLDIHMGLDDKKVGLEVQVANKGDYPERSLYYWARLFSSSLARGQNYKDLPEVVIITILDYNLKELNFEKYLSTFKLIEIEEQIVLTEKIVLKFLELKKFNPTDLRNNILDGLLSLFKAKKESELDLLSKAGGVKMKDAVDELRQILQSEAFLSYQIQREKALLMENTALKQAEEIGEKRGEKKGRKESYIELIKEGIITFRIALKLSKLTCDELKAACDKEGIEISPEEFKAAKDAKDAEDAEDAEVRKK